MFHRNPSRESRRIETGFRPGCPLVIQPAPVTFPTSYSPCVCPRTPARPFHSLTSPANLVPSVCWSVWVETVFRFGCVRSLVGRLSRSAVDPGPIERRPNFAIKDGLQFSPTQRVAHSLRHGRSRSPARSPPRFLQGARAPSPAAMVSCSGCVPEASVSQGPVSRARVRVRCKGPCPRAAVSPSSWALDAVSGEPAPRRAAHG